MDDFYEKFAMSKFASQIDRQNAIAQSWQELSARVAELESAAIRYRNDAVIELERNKQLRHQLSEAMMAKGEPSFRGYAALGTGQYILSACPSTNELPPELVISIASDEEKLGRTVGDLRDAEPGKMIQPETMAVRLAFFSVAGLDALEQQLRILREESFTDSIHPAPTPEYVRDAERLDWPLKHTYATVFSDGVPVPFHTLFKYSNITTEEANTARAAINAAMREGEKE